MTVTLRALEVVGAFVMADDRIGVEGGIVRVGRAAWGLPLTEVFALAIHGLNCQAAGITAERLGDIQMVPVIDMDEVRA